jgi:hypothetical protein
MSVILAPEACAIAEPAAGESLRGAPAVVERFEINLEGCCTTIELRSGLPIDAARPPIVVACAGRDNGPTVLPASPSGVREWRCR